MPNKTSSPELHADVAQVFKALADPTRRQVVEHLSRAPATTSQLAANFEMALPSFHQHLQVLESLGLVTSHKSGRVRTYSLKPERLQQASGWLDTQRSLWERRLDQLDEHLTSMSSRNSKDQS